MVNFLNLPGYQVSNPIDFSPLNNALDANRQQQNALAQFAQRDRQINLAERADTRAGEMHGLQVGQMKRQQGVEAARAFAGHAQSIEKMTDPAQKAAAWNRLLASHPDASNLPEMYRDPINGPRLALQEAEGFLGQKEQAALGLTRAQTAQAYAQADRARRENIETGLVPQYMVGEDGVVRPFVMNKRGEPVPVQLPQGMRALGPGGIAEAKAAGTAAGTAKVDLPKVQQNAATTIRYVDEVLKDPNLENVTGWQARLLPTVRSASVDTEERIAQLGGRAFLSAFESLKGGGQITEIEGKKATDALARLTNLKQSDAGFRQALEDFKREVRDLVVIAERKAQSGAQPRSAPAGGGNAPDPLGIR
jgi:hypothetical protein